MRQYRTPERLLTHLFHYFLWVLREYSHLPQVTLARLVALEAVLVTTLLLAHFAVPSKLRKTLRLDTVADCLRRQEAVFWHGAQSVSWVAMM